MILLWVSVWATNIVGLFPLARGVHRHSRVPHHRRLRLAGVGLAVGVCLVSLALILSADRPAGPMGSAQESAATSRSGMPGRLVHGGLCRRVQLV